MKRAEAIATLRRHRDDLRRRGAASLFLFGSTARDEAVSGSDIDLFLEYDDPSSSVIELLKLRDHISAILSTPTDLMTRGGIHPSLRNEIEQSSLRVY